MSAISFRPERTIENTYGYVIGKICIIMASETDDQHLVFAACTKISVNGSFIWKLWFKRFYVCGYQMDKH